MNLINPKFEDYQSKLDSGIDDYREINKAFKYSADDHIVLTTYGGGPSNVLDEYVSQLISNGKTFQDNTTTLRSNEDNRKRIHEALFKKSHDEIVWKSILAGAFEVLRDRDAGKFKDKTYNEKNSLKNEQSGTNILDKLKSSQNNILKITLNGHGNGYQIGEFDNKIITQIEISLNEKAKMGSKLKILYISFHSCNSTLFLERHRKTIIEIAELHGIVQLKLKAFNGYLEKDFYNQKTACFYIQEKFNEENEKLFNKLTENIKLTPIDKPSLGKGNPVYSINSKKNYLSYFFYNKNNSNLSLAETEQRFIGKENKII